MSNAILKLEDISIIQDNKKILNSVHIEIENGEFRSGSLIMIKGLAQSDDSRLLIEIINQDGEIMQQLETPITSDGTFVLPWTVPTSIEAGTYTIRVSDTENTASFEIFIQ